MPENEPTPPISESPAPDFLSASAANYWPKISKQLADCGILTEIDETALALYCEAFARWKDANAMVIKHGTVIKAPSGFPVQSPYLAIGNKAFEQMTKLLSEFGMTPSSRTRVQAVKKAPKVSRFASLNGGKPT